MGCGKVVEWGHKVEGNLICCFRPTDWGGWGFMGRILINEALCLIIALPTQFVKNTHTHHSVAYISEWGQCSNTVRHNKGEI